MSLERLQCPSCGAAVDPGGRDTCFCSYCGARLRIRQGASGNAMATLDGIKEDTSLLARQAALAHLEKELHALGPSRDALVQHCEAERGRFAASPRPSGCLATLAVLTLTAAGAVLLFTHLGLRYAAGLLVAGIAGFAVSSAILRREQARLETELQPYRARIEEIDRKADAIRQKMAALKAELDRAVGHL